MALPSGRSQSGQTTVDPDRGIYVEMPGVMEIRYISDYTDYPPEDNEDMYCKSHMCTHRQEMLICPFLYLDFQARVPEIPENFCRKDRNTSEQAMFYCIMCNCDLKNIRPLRDHVKGRDHIRKALEYKRSVLNLPKLPQNAPRQKEKKKERPVVDIGLRLQERLEEDGPAIGLEWITEFMNPKDARDHPLYTCSLEGCKSAWGNSDDMFYHVLNSKHQRNYLKKLAPEDDRIAGHTKDVILQLAIQLEEERGGAEERNYEDMKVEMRFREYIELRDRPDNWSEKKAQLGLIGGAANSNFEPLGKRRRRSLEESQFSEETGGWRPPTRLSVEEDLGRNLSRGIADLRESVELFTGGRDSQQAATIRNHLETFQILLDHSGPSGPPALHSISAEFQALKEEFEEKLEAEDRALKEMKKQMAELEEEVKNYYSNRTSTKHANIKARIVKITKDLQKLKLSINNTPLQKRLTDLWEEFETRSESLEEIFRKQQEQAEELSPVKMRLKMMERFEQELIEIVRGVFKEYKIRSKDAGTIVRKKILPEEVKAFEKTKRDWRDFKVSQESREAVKKFAVDIAAKEIRR